MCQPIPSLFALRISYARLVSYTRGTDLSGSLEGAGGIGGLLSRSHAFSSGNWTQHNYYYADGNGNITYLVNSSGGLAASYRHDPFGNLISKSGPLADANVYRFSSKEVHVNSGLYYYLYRFYSPNWQRWMNRDPIAERGGVNLHAFVRNQPITGFDPLGLSFKSGPVRFPYPNGPQDNCYSYACNRPGGPRFPGQESPFPLGQATCENILAGLLVDHPEANTPMTCDHQCPPGLHRIAVFANGDDFHFHRQDSDGGTSHKRGSFPPVQLPFPFDRDPFYEDFCGEACVNDSEGSAVAPLVPFL